MKETLNQNFVDTQSKLQLLEKLCNAVAVSGDEQEVRAIVLEHISPAADEIKIDALGNLLVRCNGAGMDRLRVMVAAHMDEVGLMLTHDEGEGLFRFELVGGLEASQLAGKPVLVGRDHIPAVIGSKPIHLTTKSERQKLITLDNLRIDVGPENKTKVKVGDRATFSTSFCEVGSSLRGKALDDRLGVAILIELVTNPPGNVDLLAAFTVQEEVGLRGARVAAYALDPHIALVLDCTTAYDLPVWDWQGENRVENTRYNTCLGEGPAIYIADSGTIYDPRLISHFLKTAQESDIPYQVRQPGGGQTDAGSIHKVRAGIPSLSISTPARYLHSPASIARYADWINTARLVYSGLQSLPTDILMGSHA